MSTLIYEPHICHVARPEIKILKDQFHELNLIHRGMYGGKSLKNEELQKILDDEYFLENREIANQGGITSVGKHLDLKLNPEALRDMISLPEKANEFKEKVQEIKAIIRGNQQIRTADFLKVRNNSLIVDESEFENWLQKFQCRAETKKQKKAFEEIKLMTELMNKHSELFLVRESEIRRGNNRSFFKPLSEWRYIPETIGYYVKSLK